MKKIKNKKDVTQQTVHIQEAEVLDISHLPPIELIEPEKVRVKRSDGSYHYIYKHVAQAMGIDVEEIEQ